jgi:hypothetical protein
MFPSALFGIAALLVVTIARLLQRRGQRSAKSANKNLRTPIKRPSPPRSPAKPRSAKAAGRKLRLVNGGGKR